MARWYQADLVEPDTGPQIELDPGGGVGLLMDRRVIAIRRAVTAGWANGRFLQGPLERSDLFVEPGEGRAREQIDLGFQRLIAVASGFSLRFKVRPPRGSPVACIRSIAAINAGEDGLEAVVIGLRNGIELVIVTSPGNGP